MVLKSKKCGLKKQEIRFEKANTNLTFFAGGGFYVAATEALNDDQCCSGSEASIISETSFCQPSYFVQTFCQLNDKTLRFVPSMGSGVGIELIPRIIVLITEFGGI